MKLIGRERELRLVEGVLAGGGARAIVLHGEAGIGKTAVWQAALDLAARHGHRVVTTRPTEAEAKLSFAGFNDLFGALVDRAADALPAPQRAAIDSALMRGGDAEPIQPLALSLGALEVIRSAAEEAPLAIGIDDVAWLDEPSASVLRFALRRLDAESVVVITCLRTDDARPTPAILADVEPSRINRVSLGPLAGAAIETLLEDRVGLQLAPAPLRRVQRASGGNPLHALEIGRAMSQSAAGSLERAHLPDSLPALVRSRLDGLKGDARAVVVHAAALARPTSGVLGRALGEEAATAGLAEARRAEVLAPGDDPIRFTYPLLAAEAYGALGDAARRNVHARLAEVVADEEERARHLALAATGPDPAVVAALQSAAALARERGARDAAADLVELAANLSGPGAGRAHLLASAGRDRLMAGDMARARRILEEALEDPATRSGAARAELLFALARVRQLMDDMVAAESLARQALRHADDDPSHRVEIHLLLAGVAFVTGRWWASGARHAAEARRLAEASGDERLGAITLGPDASWRYASGRRLPRGLADRAADAAPWTRNLRVLDVPEYDLATIDRDEGRTADAYVRFRTLAERAEREGDYSSLPFLLAIVALGDFLDGQGDAARERIDRALRLAQTTDQRTAQVHVLVYGARIEARLGHLDHASRMAESAFELMDATGWRVGEWALRADLAVGELGRGDSEAALAQVRAAIDPGQRDPSGRWRAGLGVAVEALIGLDRMEEARAVVDGTIRPKLTGRLRVELLRGQARLRGALGDQDGADAAIDSVLAAHRDMEDRWEIARSQLVAGEIHRRARRRARARSAIRDALEGFIVLGARRWAEVARDQLGRAEAGHSGGTLTPTQRTVAMMAAGGMRNRQIAGRLGMSAHTVEAHLSAVYRLLGIRRRGELAEALARHREMRDSGHDPGDSASS
jgi:DNA-binding CsgD family transcriptional regulator